MNTRTFRALLALAGLLPLSHSALAAEAFDNCTGFIDSIPTNISSQGTWCLRKDLSTAMTSGDAIAVNTANVTIDCNGYKIGGLAAGDGTQAVGINVLDKPNAVVRNCNIRGFLIGAKVGEGAPLVEDNRFEGNTSIGIQVSGAGGVVRRNLVLSTGGSTQTGDVLGIETSLDTDVIDNTIDTVAPRAGSNGSGFGIRANGATGASITGNRIRNVLSDGSGESHGIAGEDISRLIVTDNQVIGVGDGIAISCDDTASTAKDNTIAAFATGLSGCDDDGGNVLGN
ncbi:right-handed parallel beta-helix repeat-containing protein [Agrilutibacter solisilvae]|uniref:Right-handed parallel beta-helix repeat-containing protein n=1 Tax=Agrilutibacter solisilvae TaxID=2763317 RepID=A0A975ATD4_9GAMM|nr:right-handed parallel beta-helix repeat-containing protein [Lysobacter solisilvae]QSX79702.1 right-handed parallel beta-helix repeat-containing protein [Lysobacter solisilvae]